MNVTQLPLFPLTVVLFPNVPLPLHIFEERYRLLVERCIEEQCDFGVVYHRGEEIERIGCSARIDRIMKRYDDGRLDIMTVGAERFAVDEIDDEGPYLEATIHYLDEPSQTAEDTVFANAVDALLKYSYFAEIDLDRTGLEDLTANQISFLMAGIDDLGMETKQHLLEIDEPVDRLVRALQSLNEINEQFVTFARLKQAIGDDVDLAGLMN